MFTSGTKHFGLRLGRLTATLLWLPMRLWNWPGWNRIDRVGGCLIARLGPLVVTWNKR